MKQFCVLVVAVLSFSINSYAQHNYYFSSKAKTEGNGTKPGPFRSLQKLSTLELKAGDSVLILRVKKNCL